jgi:hypothetical protein
MEHAAVAAPERAPGTHSLVTALIAAVVGAAAASFAVIADDAARGVVAHPAAFAAFLAATIALQLNVIVVPEDGSVSFASIGMLGAAFALGAGPAMLVAAAAGIARSVSARGRVDRGMFDVATLALATATAAATHDVVRALDRQPNDHFAPSIFAAALFFVVNAGLVSLAMGLFEGESAFQIWKRRFRWMTPWALASGPFAAVAVVVYEQIGWVGIVGMALAPWALTSPVRHRAGRK